MNVLVSSELHYLECDGKIVSRVSSPSFFQRYLDVWDEVVLLARLTKVKQLPAESYPMDFYKTRIIGLPDFTGPTEYLRQWRKVRQIAREAVKQCDSIVLRNANRMSAVIYAAIKGTDRPFGMEVLGDPADTFARGAIHHPLRPFFRWVMMRDLKNMCHDAAATAYVTKETMQKRYPPAPRTPTTNYSSIVLKESDIVAQPRTNFSAGGAHRLISVGTFATYYKGQDLLLKAMAIAVERGCDVHCDFIGEGKHRPEIEQLAAQLGLKERAIFHGQFSSGKAVYDFLDKADLLVMSSRGEGLPRSVIEALARGLPSIGTNVGGIPELLPPKDMFPLNDPSQMAAKIMEVVGNPARLAAMSARGLKIAADYLEPLLRERRIMLYRSLREITLQWQQRHGIRPIADNRETARAN